MRILDRYLARHVYASTGFVVLVLLSILSFLGFVQELANINLGNYDVWRAMAYVFMSLPNQLYQFFPIAALIGCLFGLGQLAHSSQLTVMRAASVPIARLTWSVTKAALVMSFIMLIVSEWWAPILQNYAERMKTTAMGTHYRNQNKQLWLKQGDRVIQIGQVDERQLMNIHVYEFNQEGQLTQVQTAAQAVYERGKWQLLQVKSTQFSPKQLSATSHSKLSFPLSLSPALLLDLKQEADQQTGWGLWQNIKTRQANGLDSSQYELSFWQRLCQPLTTVVLICLSMPFMFGSLRMTSMGTRLLVGVSIGFIFYMLNRIFGPLTVVYNFPPILAALIPTACFLLGYFWLQRRTQH